MWCFFMVLFYFPWSYLWIALNAHTSCIFNWICWLVCVLCVCDVLDLWDRELLSIPKLHTYRVFFFIFQSYNRVDQLWMTQSINQSCHFVWLHIFHFIAIWHVYRIKLCTMQFDFPPYRYMLTAFNTFVYFHVFSRVVTVCNSVALFRLRAFRCLFFAMCVCVCVRETAHT